METRKVQVTGKSTYVVSLPKKWVNSIQIKNGDSVAMIPLPDGTMLINPKLRQSEKDLSKKVVPVDSGDTEQLIRKFIGAYLAGYNVIEFRLSGPGSKEVRQAIHGLSHRVIGPQLIEETGNTMTMRDLLDSSDFSLLKGVRRMYMITRDMHLGAVNLLRVQNLETANEIRLRDQEVDKLYWMIAKQYNLIVKDVFFADKMAMQPLEAQGYLLVARTLERIADHSSRLALYANQVNEKDPMVEKILAMDAEVIKLLDDAMNTFYVNKFDGADEVVNRSKLMIHRIESLTHEVLGMKGEAASIVPLAYIIDSLERTRAYASDIAETAINHYYVTDFNDAVRPLTLL
jgi:phosphate uptake regulator